MRTRKIDAVILLILSGILTVISSPASLAQSFTHADFSSWVPEANSGTVQWDGIDGRINVTAQITGNPRPRFPLGNSDVFDYREIWFGTWFDDAGVTDTAHTPDVIGVWNSGTDNIVFTFDRALDGKQNFMAFHENDFSTTTYTMEAFFNGNPLDYGLIELDNSSGSMSITNNGSSITMNDPLAFAERRHLLRFNQPFDEIRILEDNPADRTAYGFFGTGAVIPEPNSFLLLLTGVGILALRNRWRSLEIREAY
ncbi:MAG: PEP-CTERM sorting domain-containing protein [Planctomycetota bacterium]